MFLLSSYFQPNRWLVTSISLQTKLISFIDMSKHIKDNLGKLDKLKAPNS